MLKIWVDSQTFLQGAGQTAFKGETVANRCHVGLVVGRNRRAARNESSHTISAADLVADGWTFEM
jgi:hypothetical protein